MDPDDIDIDRSEECLMCLKSIRTFPGDNPKPPIDLLNDLFRVLRISLELLEQAPVSGLPPKLFCSMCTDHIVDGMHLLFRIESLQNELKMVVKILQENLSKNWTGNAGTTTSLDSVRKILVENFSKSFQNSTRGRDQEFGDAEFDTITDSSLGLLYPSITLNLNQGFPEKKTMVKRRIRKSKASLSVKEESVKEADELSGGSDKEYFPSAGEKDVSSADDEGSKRGKRDGDKREGISEKSTDFGSKSDDCYYYDEGRRLIAFDCRFCKRKLCKEDYATDSGGYVFKCFPDCCQKITDNFRNLVVHHEAFCPKIPERLFSKKRKIRTKTIRKASKAKVTGKVESVVQFPKGHRMYDGNNKLVSFECAFCEKTIFREEYLTEPGKYLFKCSPNCCEKVMDHFNNLVTHHEAFCPCKPKQLHSKHRKSTKTALTPEGPKNVIIVSEGFKYNKAHSVIAFECPRCHKDMFPSDYQTETGDYIYKCKWDNCDKITAKFVNLAYHHAVHCLNKPVRSKLKPKKLSVATPDSGKKLFACSRCPRKYKDQKGLKFHMRLHYDDERTLKCINCGKSFKSRSLLIEHKKTHEKDKEKRTLPSDPQPSTST